MKVCSRCKLLKDESEFGRDKYSRDGLNYSCKKCRLREPKPKVQSGSKVCRSCKKEKQNVEFDKHTRNSDGLRCSCIECRDKVSSVLKSKINKKTCSKCGIEKNLSEFSNLSASRDGKYPSCKECRSITSLEYYLKNHIKIKEYQKEYAILNPDKLIEQRKEYYIENSESVKKQTREYYINNRDIVIKKATKRKKQRIENDLEYRLKVIISSSFSNKLRSKGIMKELSTFEYTGISMETYLNHLKNDPLWPDYENKTQELHLDHIIPCALFNFTDPEEIKKCWNPRNLRLLPAKENILKSNKLIPELIDQYQIHDLLPAKLTSI